MRRFYTGKEFDAPKIEKVVRKAYGIPDGKSLPHGFAGAFLFDPGDVYVSDKVWSEMCLHAKLGQELYDCLRRFDAQDYGNISESDKGNNVKMRWICGSTVQMCARYPIRCCGKDILFYGGYNISVLYWEDEEIPSEWTRMNRLLQSLHFKVRAAYIEQHWPRGCSWMDQYTAMVAKLHGKISERSAKALTCREIYCLWRMKHLSRTQQIG